MDKLLCLLLACCLLAACSENAENEDAESETASAGQHLDPLTGLDTSRALITPEEAREMDALDLYPYRDGGKWGFVDRFGQEVIAPKYDSLASFSDNVAVVRQGEFYGLVDKKGREILPARYSQVTPVRCGVFGMRLPEGWVLVRLDGKRLTRDLYPAVFAGTCQEDRIPVQAENGYTFLDKDGKAISEVSYQGFFPFREGLASIAVGERGKTKWGAINSNGEIVISPQYVHLYPFKHGRAVAVKAMGDAWKYGVIDPQGKEVVPFRYDRVHGEFGESHVAASRLLNDSTRQYDILNRNGKLSGQVSDMQLWDSFSEGLIVAEKDGKFGFVDTLGQVKIPLRYNWACGFSQGLAWVQKGNRFGFIDREGKIAIPFLYYSPNEYVFMEEDGAQVMDPKTGEVFFISPEGREFRKK